MSDGDDLERLELFLSLVLVSEWQDSESTEVKYGFDLSFWNCYHLLKTASLFDFVPQLNLGMWLELVDAVLKPNFLVCLT